MPFFSQGSTRWWEIWRTVLLEKRSLLQWSAEMPLMISDYLLDLLLHINKGVNAIVLSLITESTSAITGKHPAVVEDVQLFAKQLRQQIQASLHSNKLSSLVTHSVHAVLFNTQNCSTSQVLIFFIHTILQFISILHIHLVNQIHSMIRLVLFTFLNNAMFLKLNDAIFSGDCKHIKWRGGLECKIYNCTVYTI